MANQVLSEGMMWYQKPAKPEAVRDGAKYFQEKYGHKPTLVLVNASDLPAIGSEVDGIAVEPAKFVMKSNYLFRIDQVNKVTVDANQSA